MQDALDYNTLLPFMAAYNAYLNVYLQHSIYSKPVYITIDALNHKLFDIFMRMKTYHLEDAKYMTRETIMAINTYGVENITMGSMAIDVLYRILVDLTFMRVHDAKQRVREFHDVWHECPMSMYIIEDLEIDA